MDRIDIQIEVPRVPREALKEECSGENTETVKKRVVASREVQINRCGKANSEMSNKEIDRYCKLDDKASDMLDLTMERFRLSARAYHRILKVARTCADLAGETNIGTPQIGEAIGYRAMDRWLGR